MQHSDEDTQPWFRSSLFLYTVCGFAFLAFVGWAFFKLLI